MIVYWDSQDEIFVLEVPEPPGCMAHGGTRTQAISNAETAMRLWLETAKIV